MDFNGIIPGLQTKSIDAALAGITIREDRAKVVDFSDPYYESGLAILAPRPARSRPPRTWTARPWR